MADWYVIAEDGEPVGPVETELVVRGISAGKIPLGSKVCAVSETTWMSLSAVPEFAAAIRAVAPPPPPPTQPNAALEITPTASRGQGEDQGSAGASVGSI